MERVFCYFLIGLLVFFTGGLDAQQRFEPAEVYATGMGVIVEGNVQLAYEDAITTAQQQAVMRIAERILPKDQRDQLMTILNTHIRPNARDFIANAEEIDRTSREMLDAYRRWSDG